MRRQPARASFLRASASSPLSVRLNLTLLALCHLARPQPPERMEGLLAGCCSSTVVSKPRVLVRSRKGMRVLLISPVVRAV